MKPIPKNSKHLITRNDALDERIEKHPYINTEIEKLFAIGRRNRQLIKLLYVSVVLEIILIGAVAYFGSQVIVNRDRTESTHFALVNTCNSNNSFRKDNLAIWDYILGIKSQQPPTDEQKKVSADFKAFVLKTFAPRDCNNL